MSAARSTRASKAKTAPARAAKTAGSRKSAPAPAPDTSATPDEGPALAAVPADEATKPMAKEEASSDVQTPEVPDPVPEGVRQLAEIFGAELAEVRFPDVDQERLEAACQDLRATHDDVTRAFEALEAAQARLAERRGELTRLAERGLAYARVFAGDQAELVEKLDAVDLGPKKTGRKPKAKMVPKAERARRPKVEAVPDLLSEKPEAPSESA